MRSPTRARSARSAIVAGVAALALATGGFAYGASVVGGGSTADVQPDEGTPGIAPGGTADIQPAQGVAPTSVDPGSTAGLQQGTSQAPATGVTSGDVDKSDRGVKGAKPTKDRGVKNAPVTTG